MFDFRFPQISQRPIRKVAIRVFVETQKLDDGYSKPLLDATFLAIGPRKEWLRLDVRGVKDLGKASGPIQIAAGAMYTLLRNRNRRRTDDHHRTNRRHHDETLDGAEGPTMSR